MRTSEENFEEARNLSPIEEESESNLCLKGSSISFTEGSSSSATIRYMDFGTLKYKKSDSVGDSSSESERTEQDYHQLGRAKGNHCCFRRNAFSKEAEASGDNDEAEPGLRDNKSLETTVEQLKRRLSQAEREIVVLKRYQAPQRCRSHERFREILQRDLLNWRDDHEKRINSRIVRWQLAERRRIHDETENTRKVYDSIQRHLETLERRSARSYFDFRRQIDVWEKRLKDDVVSLHESNLTELRQQLKAWFEMQNSVNLPNARKDKCKVYDLCDDAAVGRQEESYESTQSERATLCEDKVEFLRRINRIIKFEVQQQRVDLVKRLDRKIAELWSAFEDFKHNFQLDRDYRRRDYVEMNNDRTESNTTEDLSDFTCRESAKSDLNTDFEEKCITS